MRQRIYLLISTSGMHTLKVEKKKKMIKFVCIIIQKAKKGQS